MLVAKRASPASLAVTVSAPCGSVETEMLALSAVVVAVPSRVAPCVNVTVCPNSDGFCDDPRTVVVAYLLTS